MKNGREQCRKLSHTILNNLPSTLKAVFKEYTNSLKTLKQREKTKTELYLLLDKMAQWWSFHPAFMQSLI